MFKFRKIPYIHSALIKLSIAAFLVFIPFTQSSALTLKIATISPEGAVWMVKMRQAAKEITKRTDNRVKFKFYPGGIMGNDQSVLRKIRIGQLHGGALTNGNLDTIYPDIQLYSLPFLFHSNEEVSYIREKMDDIFIKGLEKRGYVTFGFAEGGFAYLMSNKPLKDVSDLQQQKIWVPAGDTIAQTIFNSVSVSPVPLPISDVMTSLQTGLIDTVVTSPIGAIALQWHTRVKYLTDTPLSYFYAFLAINKKTFKKISPDDQLIVREIMTNAFKEIDAQNRKDNINAKKALENQGIKFVKISDKTLSAWHQTGEKAREILKNKGIYSPEVLKTLEGHLESFRNSHSTTRK